MKKVIILIGLLNVLPFSGYCQWELIPLPIYSATNNEFVSNIYFLNADVGWTIATYSTGPYTNPIILKTSNKGVNWTSLNYISTSSSSMPYIYFKDINTGYVFTSNQFGTTTDLSVFRTTDGGTNWSLYSTKPNLPNYSFNFSFTFHDILNIFYLNTETHVVKSTDYGYTWNIIMSQADFNNGIIKDFDANDNNLFIAGRKGTITGRPVLYKSTNAGINYTVIANGDIQSVHGIENISYHIYNNIEYLKFVSVVGIGSYANGSLQLIAEPYSNDNFIYKDIRFTNKDVGTVYLETKFPGGLETNKLIRTSNEGNNWFLEEETPGVSNIYDISSRGDLVYSNYINRYHQSGQEIFFYTRKLEKNVYAKSDLTQNNVSGVYYYMDNSYGQLPVTTLTRGGTFALSQFNGTFEDKIFYKWHDNFQNASRQNYYFDKLGDIIGHYKTKQFSTIPTSINNANQTKAIRDKNGVVHQIHQSMGGIFYTRSTDNGTSWKKEEVVNYEANSYNAEGNIDPVISEVFSEHVPALDGNKNVTAVWNRREGSNEVIKFAYRTTVNGTDYFWQRDNSYDITIPAASQYYPQAKTFTRILNINDPHNYYVLTPYLKKESGTTHLKVFSRPSIGGNVVEHNIESGNIEEFSVACKHNSNSQILYFIYKQDGQYNYESFSFNLSGSSIAMTQVDAKFNISAGDAVQTRTGADISLRNGLPVITYRGYVPALRIINYEDNQTQQIPLNYYPIVVRYKTTAAGNPWSPFSKYNSSGFNTQENPNVEGSKDYAAHLINYSVNNAQFRQHVKIDNLTGYYCNPGTFTGTDAKLIRGSYTGQFGANSYPSLLTLQPESGNYRVGKQTFTITNQVQPISQTDSYSNLSGVVEMQNVEYAFNLGPIITTEQIELDGLPQSITNPLEFVDNLVSDVFKLSEGDTLIVGANPSYIAYEDGVFQTINFNVNLVNNSTGQVDRLLFRDSVELIDSVESEYLRGFVITSLREPDSFYVQIDIDQEDLNNGDYYFNGEYQGNNDDNIVSPKIIFEISSPELPIEYSISQNYPNPFNPVTNIIYDLPHNGIVSLIVYDITGKQVAQLVNGYKPAGSHTVSFNGSALSSGVYFYKIQAGDFTAVKRMVLIK